MDGNHDPSGAMGGMQMPPSSESSGSGFGFYDRFKKEQERDSKLPMHMREAVPRLRNVIENDIYS